MTINEAFGDLVRSSEFIDASKARDSAGAKYRVYLGRFKKDTLKAGAMVEMLLLHGYEITANKTVIKKPKGKAAK